MELEITNKKFVCVDYPGVVKNADNMLKTLGGIKNVSKTYSEPTKRLELFFRPSDFGGRPCFGDREPCTGLLLRVKRRRQQQQLPPTNASNDDMHASFLRDVSKDSTNHKTTGYEYAGEILGIVETAFVFQSMSDFQYLPMVKNPDNSYSNIREKVFISSLHNRSYLDEPAPLFLLPSLFSRFDRPSNYCYREVTQSRSKDIRSQSETNVIGVSRRRRPHHTIFVMFSEKCVPMEPDAAALRCLQRRRTAQEKIDEVTEQFTIQPIWARASLFARTSASILLTDLASILPTIAYYMSTGPWRSMWVRFGYDPRQHPEAKVFQNLDVRLRRYVGNDEITIQPKRSTFNYTSRNTVQKFQSQASYIQQSAFGGNATDLPSSSEKPASASYSIDATYRFRPGQVPAFRQMFYQLCYVDEPQVQRLVHINDGKETVCLEKDGWCLAGTIDRCREICRQHLSKVIGKDLLLPWRNALEMAADDGPPTAVDPVPGSSQQDESSSDSETIEDRAGAFGDAEDYVNAADSASSSDEEPDESLAFQVTLDDDDDVDDEDGDMDVDTEFLKQLKFSSS